MIKKIYHKVKSLFQSDLLYPENKELLALFGNAQMGYVLGTSETISKLDILNLGKDAVKITIGNFFEHPDIDSIAPTVHVFAASHVPITEAILKKWWSRCESQLPANTPVLVSHKDFKVAQSIFKSRAVYRYSYGGSCPVDFTKKILTPGSVSVIAVQLAIYLGIKNTFLLGIDHDWQNLSTYKHFYSHQSPSLELFLAEDGIELYKKDPKIRKPKKTLYSFYGIYKQHEKLKEAASFKELSIFNGDPFSGFDVYEMKPIFPLESSN